MQRHTLFVGNSVGCPYHCSASCSLRDHSPHLLPELLPLILTSSPAIFSFNFFSRSLLGKLFEILSVIVGEAERYEVRACEGPDPP